MKLHPRIWARGVLLLLSVFVINSVSVFAQDWRCATMYMDSVRRANDPDAGSLQDFEDWMEKLIQKKRQLQQSGLIIDGVYQIPVVFHVIHDGDAVGSGNNLSQAIIQSQLDVLNEDFRKMFGTNGYNTHPDGADTKIEFCLSRRRPNGSAFPGGEDGINRITTSSAGWNTLAASGGSYSTAYVDANVKPWCTGTQFGGWDPADYMNIWIVPLSGGVLGYAQFPTTILGGMSCTAQSTTTDGVVFTTSSIGKSSVSGFPGPYNEGRTATHEIGHWLGLRHIWGDGNCTVDDYCADTPLSDAANFGCPVTNSCTDPAPDPNDMVENYMDYTDDLCMNIFTYDQMTRMRIVLENSPIRASLINSDACIPPAVSDASVIDIITPKGDNCPGAITPQVTLRNRGSSNLTSATISYTIDGGTPTTFSWTGSIASGAQANVTLPAFTTTLGVHTIRAYSTLPNGVTDPDPIYDTTTLQFAVSNGYQPNYSEDFEAGQFPPDVRWLEVNPNSDCFEWVGQSCTSSTGAFPNDAAMMPNYGNTSGQDEYLYTPIFILPCNATSAQVSFDKAYRRRVTGSTDRLRLEMSTNCGSTWTTIFDQSGTTLQTVTTTTNSYWIPSASGNWANVVVNLSSYITASSQNLQFRFRGTNTGASGGNIYVDNFNFTAVTPGEIEIAVSGTEVLDGGYYNYGTVAVGSPTTAVFTITNPGTSNLVLTPPISITGASEFTLNSTFGVTTVPAGGSTTFSIDFTPTGAGPFTANVSFTTNDCDEGTYNFVLNGAGSVSPPNAGFTATPTTICAGSTVTYTSTATGASSWSWSFPGGTPNTATGVGPHVITYNTAGTYNASQTVTNAYGSDTDTQTGLITVLNSSGNALPVTEGFTTATFPPTNWSITNGGSAITWVRSASAGNAPTAGNSAYIDNFNTNFAGAQDDLNMPPADFSSLVSAQLQFDVAYAPYNTTYFDKLQVVVSSDCGQTWTNVYDKEGTTLATQAAQTTAYTNPTTWRTETVDLSAFVGASKVEVKFRNVSGYGQLLYIDNVNLTGVVSAATANFTMTPNPVCVGQSVTFTDASAGATSWSWNFGAGASPATATGAGPHVVTYSTSGSKSVSLSINSGASVSNQTLTVNALDNASFNYGASAYCANAADPTPTAVTSGGTYSSSPAGLSINASTGTIDVSASATGTYTVTYTTAGACPNSANVSVTINAVDNASFSYAAGSYCQNAADPTPAITGLAGGTFSSTAGLSINASTGTIDVSASTAGTYTVTYTTAGTCPNSSNVSVTINALDNASFSYGGSTFCQNGVDQTPAITGLGGGTFSSSPAGLSLNSFLGAIDVSASAVGTYTVTYTTAGACPNSSNVSVTITAADNAGFSYASSSYCNIGIDPTPTITGLGGGTFSSSPAGLSINASTGTITLASSASGTYTITYTTAGACPASANQSVTINPSPATPSVTNPSVCVGSSVVLQATGSGSGALSFYDAGSSLLGTYPMPPATATQNVGVLAAGTYTYYAVETSTAGCPSIPASIVATVNNPDNASFNYSGSSYCTSAADPTPTITGLGGGTFSSTAGLSINASTGTIDVSASTAGTYTVTYTTAGTCPNSSNVSITITGLDDATFSYGASAYCVSASDPTPTAVTSGGTYSASPAGLSINASTGAIDVSASTPNTYTVTYTTAGACANSSNVSVTINALDNASFSYGGSTFCQNGVDQTPAITGLAGGTFSSSPAGLSVNSFLGAIDVSASAPGTYTVTYTTAGTCPNSSNVSVTITAADNASFSYSGSSFCASGADPTPTITGLGGGTFSSTAGLSINASTGTIDVSASTAGTYTVTYTTAGTCPNSSNVSITITGLDDATFSYGASAYCVSASDPTPTAVTSGGTYSASPAGLSINSSTGTIDVSASTPGAYTVTYTTSGSCANSSNVSVTINALDNASFSYGGSTFCQNGVDQTPAITGLAGGTFSSSPAGLSVNSFLGAIDVSASAPGTYTVTYTTAGTCPNSSNVSVTITAADNASFSYSGSSFCASGADPTPVITGLAGGTFSSTAGLSINVSTGTIDVSASTAGTYTVTYTTAGTCPNSSNVSITITGLDDATFSYGASAYCVSASDPTPTAVTSGGTYSASPAGLSINASTGAIDVSASTPNTYTVTYTTAGACANSSNVSVTINALDNASFSYGGSTFCQNGSDQTPAITGLAGGTFSSSPAGLSVNSFLGAIDVSASAPGTYTVTYTTAGTCPNSSNVSVTITAADNASFSYGGSAFCQNGVDQTPSITGLPGGTFSSSPAGLSVNSFLGAIDVSASAPGTYTVTYTTAGTCPNSSNVSVTITAADNASFSYSSSAYCTSALDPTPTITGLAGGTFSSSPAGLSINASTGAIDVSASALGTYTVTYTTSGACPASSNASVIINSGDDASFSYATSAFCAEGTDPAPTITGTTGGTFTSLPAGLSINGTTGVIDLSASTAGTYTVTYTTGGACSASSNVSVTVNATPAAPVITPGGSTTICSGSSVTLTSSYGSGNVWSTLETTPVIVVNSTGSYDVTFTDGNGCTATSAPTVVTVGTLLADPVITTSGATTFCAGGNVTLTSSYANGNTWSTSDATPSIVVTSSGTYSVTYTDGNGCAVTSSPVTVTVNAAPSAPTITASGATSFCAGGSVDLISSQASGNTWSTSATTSGITVTNSGSYTVTYTDGNGCTATSAPTTVVVNALPAAPVVTTSGSTSFCSGGSVSLISSYATGNLWSTTETTQNISVNVSGSYTVTYTDGNGCSSTSAPTTVSVYSTPPTPTITANGPTVFCEGDSVELSASQSTGLLWSNSASTPSIWVYNSGNFYVTYTDPSGCASTSATLGVTVNAMPSVVLGTFSDVCSYVSPYSLSGGTPSGGTYSGPGVSSGMFDPAAAGTGVHTITYTYSDGNGCMNSAQSTITVKDCSGLTDLTDLGVKMYPNPTFGVFTIQSGDDMLQRVTLFDAAGRVIISDELQDQEITLNISGMSPGMYIVEIVTTSGHARTQLIKQ